MFRGMTVAEMSPIELYATVMSALVMFAVVLRALREWPNLDEWRQKAVFCLGLFVVTGLPLLLFLNVVQSS